MDAHIQQQPHESAISDPLAEERQFREYPYRWVIVALMGFSLLVNGLGNNTVIPIASKLASVYSISDAYVSAPIIISFLVYSLVNFPANHIIDTQGLRRSFLIGSGFYMVGIFLYVMIDKGYYYTIFGAILVAIGQPFIINCPAKVATYWFLDKNRTVATALMTGINFIGTAVGFVLPTLIVHEDSQGSDAHDQIFYLYAGQFFISSFCFLLIYIFMRKNPPTLPSIGAEQQKTPIKQSFKLIKKDKNLWVFFGGYIILYGTLLSFGSTANLLFKPYGYEDIQIALFAVVLIATGLIGSICYSLYIRKTNNYRRAIQLIPATSLFWMTITCIVLNTTSHSIAGTFFLVALIGFSFTPLVPISYDLGCELSFPIGQAQVTGILNGGAMIFTFILTIITTSTISFQNSSSSMIVMIIFIVLMFLGTVTYFFVKINLKRRNAEKQGHTVEIQNQLEKSDKETRSESVKKQIEMTSPYENFIDEKY